MKVLVIIPAYNEEKNIKAVVESLQKQCPCYDYMIFNDCSTDNTLQVLRRGNYPHVTLPINLGIGGNVQAGYLYAQEHGYDVAVQFDGDGQHNPAYIGELLAPILRGEADMVIGSRFIKKAGFQTSFARRGGITILKWVIRLCCGLHITDATSGFRAVSRRGIGYFANYYAHDYPEPEAIVTSVLEGFAVKEIPVEMNERVEGVSSIGGWRSVYYMIKVSLALILLRIMYIGKRRGK